MTDGELLLRRIVEVPAEDVVRLAYADWLEGEGNLDRAEFVRVQVELAHLGEGWPSDMRRKGRYTALRRRERELWKSLQFREWFPNPTKGGRWVWHLGAWESVNPSGPGWIVRRGFPDEVRCSTESAYRYAKALFAAYPVTRFVSTDLVAIRGPVMVTYGRGLAPWGRHYRCTACRGRGTLDHADCPNCEGKGRRGLSPLEVGTPV